MRSVKRFLKAPYRIKQLFKTPYKSEKKYLIIHCCHHKVGTTWFTNIFRAIGNEYGLPFNINDKSLIPKGPSLFIDDHSKIDLRELTRPYKGSHMIRDPRDIVVSGYHYTYGQEKNGPTHL